MTEADRQTETDTKKIGKGEREKKYRRNIEIQKKNRDRDT